MATISELNVRLGLLYKDFDASMKKVERDLERSGRKFSQLGTDLTLAISAPLAALGAAAIKQAGEIESLKLAMTSTFESAGRSAADAAKEVEALREAAKAPGLDFEQAVKGSIRLQGVGLAAEEARRILSEMANAIASTGGTAEDLDGVTRQFSQMLAKGRVLQEDVSILAERMPVIATLMQKAFGTASVEAIRNSGVSAKQFVDRITEAAAALPRVEGGIKNALVNAGAEARNALAQLGETLVKTFDLPKTLERFTEGLSGVVAWFDRLSDGAKSAIAQTGLFLVVLGPLVKVIGTVIATGGAAVTVLRGIGTAIAALASGTLTATAAWQTLNLAMRATVIGAVLTAVTALYIGIDYLAGSMDTAAVAGRSLAKAQEFIAETAATEIVELQRSIAVLSNVTSSQKDRAKAIADLTTKYPDYLKGINLEIQTAGQLAIIQRELTNEIIKQSAARAKANAESELTAKIVEKELKLFKLRQDEREGAFTLQDRSFIIQNEQNKLEQLKKQLDVVRETYDKVFKLNESSAANSRVIEIVDPKSVKNAGDAAKAVGEVVAKTQEQIEAEKLAAEEAAKAAKRRKELYADVLKSIDAVNKKQAELGADFVGEKTKEIEGGVEKLIEAGFAPNSAPVQKLKGYLQEIRASITAGLGGFSGAQAVPTLQTPGSVQSTQQSGADAGIQQAKALAQAYQESGRAFEDFTGRMEEKQGAFDKINQSLAEAKNGVISWGEAMREIGTTFSQAWEQSFSQVYEGATNLANGIVALGQQRAENEKAQLDAEYAAKIEAAQGNATAIAAIEADLAKKKEEIDKRIGKRQKAVAITTAIIDTALGVAKALGSAPPPYNFVLASLTAAAGAVQIATIKAQPFAEGGVITKPTFGLVGEYPGATRNPEIITPERLMRSVFREEAGGMGGKVEVYGVIRGSDIFLSNEKATRDRGRIR